MRQRRIVAAVAAVVIVAAVPRVASSAEGHDHAALSGLDGTLRHFAHIDASRSLVELLPLLGGLEGAEREAARLLAGVALVELGLHAPAIEILRGAVADPSAAAAATVALCRIHSDLRADRELLALVAEIDGQGFSAEDLGEVAYRAARAAYRQERFAETRAWLRRVPEGSSFAPFAAYLSAQTEFAAGDTDGAIAAAEPLLRVRAASPTVSGLQDRAAIFLGDLYTELGRYDEAVERLARPSAESPFAARARRDRLVAEGMRQLAAGEFEDARPVVARLHAYLEGLAGEVDRSVRDDAEVEARARELRGVWPPKFAVYERRDWTVRRAEAVLAREASAGPNGLVPILAYVTSVPAIWRREDGRWKADPWLPERERTSRFFFPPPGGLARLLQALALLEEPAASWGTPCSVRAATAMRQRIAVWLLGDAPSPSLDDLARLATTCDVRPPHADLLVEARLRLHQAILDEAARIRRQIERDRLEIEMAIGQAYLRHVEDLDAARREAAASAPGTIAQR